jgi:sporulation protein YlmC with PRC-barrel domain
MWITVASAFVVNIVAVQAQVFPEMNPLTQEQPLAARGSGKNSAAIRKASRLIGSEVHNYQGDKIGKVDDIALNRNSDTISYLVLATGGFLGIGEKYAAVPLHTVRTDLSGERLMVNLSRAALKDVPKLNGSWPSSTEQELREANNFFALNSTEFSEWLQKEPEAGEKMVPQVQQLTADQERWMRRASNLVGINVQNMQNREIGELTDLVLDMGTGKVAFGLIELQNIEGLENQMAACPWGSISVQPQEKIAKVNASDSTLRSVAFRSENMPDLSNRLYVNNVYRQFNQEPYWATYGYEGEEPEKQKQDIKPMGTREEDYLLPLFMY